MFGLVVTIVAGLTFLVADAGLAVCPDGIVGYWKLDESGGSTYADFVGGNDGTGAADPVATPGRVAGAQDFDGGTMGIDIPASSL